MGVITSTLYEIGLLKVNLLSPYVEFLMTVDAFQSIYLNQILKDKFCYENMTYMIMSYYHTQIFYDFIRIVQKYPSLLTQTKNPQLDLRFQVFESRHVIILV